MVVVSVTPRPRFSPGKGLPRYPLYRRLGGPQSQSGHRGQRKNPLPLPGIEPWSLGRPARSQTLYWLSYPALKPMLPTWNFPIHSEITSPNLNTILMATCIYQTLSHSVWFLIWNISRIYHVLLLQTKRSIWQTESGSLVVCLSARRCLYQSQVLIENCIKKAKESGSNGGASRTLHCVWAYGTEIDAL
jgi:hypothetical protein